MTHPGAVVEGRLGQGEGESLSADTRGRAKMRSLHRLAQEAALGTVPIGVLPAVSISGSSFRT